MNKEELKSMMAKEGLSKQELMELLEQKDEVNRKEMGESPAHFMYYLGGTVLFLGVYFLFWQIWDSIPSLVRIILPAIAAFAFMNGAKFASSKQGMEKLVKPMNISAILMVLNTLGVYVFEYAVNYDSMSLFTKLALTLGVGFLVLWLTYYKKDALSKGKTTLALFVYAVFMAWGSGVLTAEAFDFTSMGAVMGTMFLFLALYLPNIFFKRNILSALGFLAFNGWYAALSGKIIEGFDYYSAAEIGGLLMIVLGFIWLYVSRMTRIGSFMSESMKPVVRERYANILTFLAALGLLANSMQMDKWVIVALVVVAFMFYAAQTFYSRQLLVFGVFGAFIYVFRLIFDVFGDGIGLPIALIISGLVIIGVGYYAIKIRQRIDSK